MLGVGWFKKSDYLGLIFFTISYLFGILSPAHYSMGDRDFYISLMNTALVSFGLVLWCLGHRVKKIGYSSLTWLSLSILIILQPMINDVAYADALIFPFGVLLMATTLSIVVVNIDAHQKNNLIKGMAWVFLMGGLLTVSIQFIQLFFPNHKTYFIYSTSTRLYANIAQPNQAGFVIVLAITSAIYLFYLNYKQQILSWFLVFFILFLSIGVSFSISRAALILLMFVAVGMFFYRWQSLKLRISLTLGVMLVSAMGYQLGNDLMTKFFSGFQGYNGVERLTNGGFGLRTALYDRAFSALKSDPITGIGYNNYLGYGVENVEKWWWFENADHAHNVLLQIGSELGLIGLLLIIPIFIILAKQLFIFFTRQLSTETYFVCLLTAIFVLYSFSEYPLWYARFLFAFAFLVALLDVGFDFKNNVFHKILLMMSLTIGLLSIFYFRMYDYYLYRYEVINSHHMGDQEKIDAYKSLPHLFGFTKFKEEMLYVVADANINDQKQLIAVGDRLIQSGSYVGVMRFQVQLLVRDGQTERADKMYRTLCIDEYQYRTLSGQEYKNCSYTFETIGKLDPDDEMGYAKRLNEWYIQRYGNNESFDKL